MTLNTFHYAGVSAKNVTLGVPRLKEIINIAKKIKTPTLTIYLDKTIRDDSDSVKKLQSTLEYCTLRTITAATEIYYDPDPENTEIEEDRDFVETFWSVEEEERAKIPRMSPWLLRMELSREMMTDKGLLMEEVARKITSELGRDSISVQANDDNDEKLILRIRILRDEDEKDLVSDESQSDDQFLRKLEQQILDTVTLKGIPGIKKVFMRQEKMAYFDDNGDLKRDREQWVLDTEGINLLQVLSHDGVDPSQTYSNDICEIVRVLGIEAVRQGLLRELRGVIEFDGSYVNYRHLSILADVMTMKGDLMAITRHGINRAETGVLMRCSFEETVEILMNAAAYAEPDHMRGVSENLMLGQLCPLGTGLFDLLLDTEELAHAIPVIGPDDPYGGGGQGHFPSPSDPMYGGPMGTPFDRTAVTPPQGPFSPTNPGTPYSPGPTSPWSPYDAHALRSLSVSGHALVLLWSHGRVCPMVTSNEPCGLDCSSSPSYSASPGYTPSSPAYRHAFTWGSLVCSFGPSGRLDHAEWDTMPARDHVSGGCSSTSPAYSPTSPAYSRMPTDSPTLFVASLCIFAAWLEGSSCRRLMQLPAPRTAQRRQRTAQRRQLTAQRRQLIPVRTLPPHFAGCMLLQWCSAGHER